MKLKKKKRFTTIYFTFIILLFLIVSFFGAKQIFKDNNDTLINISELSEEFMNNYFEENNEIETEEKRNTLIITSNKNIEETYGATKVIEAPNNQYILQYENEEDKNKALSEFVDDISIVSAEENGFYTIEETTYNSWGVESMSLDYVTTILNADELKNVTVAIIDTGLDVELANKYYSGKIVETYNVLQKSTTIMTDENGHGTHVFGTIAESTPANVKILPIKVSENGTFYYTDIIAAINYITYYEKADVINMSFGGYGYNQALEQAIEAAKEKNIISVAAAGNDNTSANHYPSALNNTISIASVDSDLKKSTFSNYGSKIDFTAPGTNIKSIMSSETSISKNNGNIDGDDDHETISGTSMATPHAVSAVAILKSIKKDLTLENTIELLKSRTVDLGEPGWDKYYGYGLISFENVEFCDGSDCDKYNVFKEASKIVPTSIEVKYALRTSKNYGTVNNLIRSEVRIYDSTGNYVTTTLGKLSDVEILGYDAYETEEQVITVKWQGLETTFNFTNPTDWNSGWTYEVIENNDIIITGFTDHSYTATKLYIPEKIDGYNVVAIGNESSNIGIFHSASKTAYEEIILPSSLIEIKGKYTFSNFDVKKITALSNSLKITGDYVFANNQSLVEFVGTIGSLGKYTFANDILLQKVTLSDDMTEIPAGAFYLCFNLENINIPSKLVTIGSYAFYNNLKLNNITLPEGLKTIGDRAFSYTDIDNVILPESLEQIGESAFENTNMRNLYISKNLISIGEKAFLGCSSLESIIVDEENPIYDSRENSNALIETKTNTILKGIANTTIPETVTIIGDYAYSDDLRIEEIEIPETVLQIGNYAFYYCNYLKTVKIPRNVTTIGDNAFSIKPTIREDNQQIPLTIYTYNDAYAKSYAAENEINYETMDYTAVIVRNSKTEYKAFDKVNILEDITDIMLEYNVGKTKDSSYSEGTTFKHYTEGFDVKYINNNDSFRYGDTYYIVSGKDVYGESFEKQVVVTISKVTPTYTKPTNLTASVGQKLSEIMLPDGFEWMNPNEIISDEGNIIFKAKYTPEDVENYEIIENIEITVSVNNPKQIIEPNIVISDKTYDGTAIVSTDSITISNLEKSEYSIESVISSSTDVGDRIATVTIKLTDEKFEKYTFEGGMQEKSFTINFKIVPEKLLKPTLKTTKYIYNGVEQSAELNNYCSDKMYISGNVRKNVGEQDIIILLKNNNYIWDDNSSDNVILKFKIEKAIPKYIIPTNLTASVGQKLFEIMLPEGFEWTSENVVFEESGIKTYEAKYTPEDTENYKIIENIEITINVSSNKYSVTFDANGGMFNENKTTIVINDWEDSKLDSLETPTREGHIFKGYYTEKTGGISLENYITETGIVQDDLVFYAQWEIEKYTLTFDANGGEGSMNNQEFVYDISQKITKNAYTKSGYKFKEWNTKINGTGMSYSDEKEIKLSENITLYAQWEESYSYIINKYPYDNSNNYIDKIDINTTVDDFKKNIDLNIGYSIDVSYKTIGGKNLLYTGGKTKIYNNNKLIAEYTNIIRGEVTGDGKINYLDYVTVYNHIQKVKHPESTKKELQNEYLVSADMSGDGKVNYLDYVKIYNKIKELKGGN